jgi:hypothetical protein
MRGDTWRAQVDGKLAGIPQVGSKLGVFVRRDGARVVVSLGGREVLLPFVGVSLPPAGHSVQVESRPGGVVVTGAAAPLPGVAKVTAVNGQMVSVSAWGRTYSLRFGATYTPAVGDEVSVIWSADGGLVQDRVSAPVAVPPAAPVPLPASGSFHPGPFTATGSGSFGSRWFTNDVYASSSNTGGWWYGSKVRDTIPDGARIDGAAIYLNPRQASGSNPVMRLHSSEGQPGGPLAFVGAPHTVTSARSGWVGIPTAWVDYLKANPGGIGFEHGGYTIFRGTGADALSGALDLSWTA